MISVRLVCFILLFWGSFFVGKVQAQNVYVACGERSGNIFVYNAHNGQLLKTIDPCKEAQEDVEQVDQLLFGGNTFFILTSKYLINYNLQSDDYQLIERKIPNVDGLKVLTNKTQGNTFIGYDEDKGTIFVWKDVSWGNARESSYYTYDTGCKKLGVCLSEHDPGILFYWDKCSNYISIFNFVTGKEGKPIAMESEDECDPVECRVDSVASCPDSSNFVVSYKKITEVVHTHYGVPFNHDKKEMECVYECCVFDRSNHCFFPPFYKSDVSCSYFSTHVLVHPENHDVCALRVDRKLMFFNMTEGRELSFYKYSDALIKFAFVPLDDSRFFCVAEKVSNLSERLAGGVFGVME